LQRVVPLGEPRHRASAGPREPLRGVQPNGYRGWPLGPRRRVEVGWRQAHPAVFAPAGSGARLAGQVRQYRVVDGLPGRQRYPRPLRLPTMRRTDPEVIERRRAALAKARAARAAKRAAGRETAFDPDR
jgi:hypothetical protein